MGTIVVCRWLGWFRLFHQHVRLKLESHDFWPTLMGELVRIPACLSKSHIVIQHIVEIDTYLYIL